eukprot:CAMPEP_0202705958 /NCGR_PEP_ID=MMETSP1385-20130828/18448_1 /ASSEMBLY_ACC=CAM_ASM_000861 /TAXON_ID=933848 /ORGANISM="Elphidium margaritaceum" /LENGTH=1098 /DNA_ID=CAMNT_0049364321 /DNA_START=25 /DNA_END=3321 /DNA_ORIENTATION=-
MAEVENGVNVQQWVDQAVPKDPSKMRLSLIFHKDLVATLQQDIADLHHRLKIADTEYDGTQDAVDDAEDDMRAGIHVNNATLTKMDGWSAADQADNEADHAAYDKLYDDYKTNANANDQNDQNDDDDDDDDNDDEREHALNKISTDHERFFSTYNLLSKQTFTQDSLIESMGSFEALLHLSDNAVTFTDIVANLKLRLKTAKDACMAIRDAMDGLGVTLDDPKDMDALGGMDDMLRGGSLSEEDDEDLERNLFMSNAKEILRESDKIVATIDSTMDELNGAKHLIHPDHRKIFALQSRIKELQVCLPVHKLKKLAVLKELPRFIRDELTDAKIQKQAEAARELQRVREQKYGHKKKRTKTLVEDEITRTMADLNVADIDDDDDKADDSERREARAEESRIEHYESTMEGVNGCVDAVQKSLANIVDTLSAMNSDIDAADDPSMQLLKGSIDAIREDIVVCEDKTGDIGTYYRRAKQYVHPTQNVLITAANAYVEQKIANDALQKQIAVLKGELCAKQEQIAILKAEKLIQHQSSLNLKMMHAEEDTDDEQCTQQFVQSVVQQLQSAQRQSSEAHQLLKIERDDGTIDEDEDAEAKNKSSLGADEIKQLDAQLTQVRESVEELTTALMSDETSVLRLTPSNEYTLRLEQRYAHLKQLYRLKFKELESAKDAVVYTESELQTKHDEIEELEQRLVRIMTSASSSAETRMEAIDSMAQKTQTYGTVMDLVEENVRTTSSALRAIETIYKQHVSDATQLRELQTLTKTMRKGLDAVQQEMSGARNFVHPDREMVHVLQEEILKLRSVDDEDDAGGDDDDDGDGNGGDTYEDEEENEEKEKEMPTATSSSSSSSHVSRNSRVHFKSKTSRNVGFAADAATSNGLLASSSRNRRTKSVHEIAWSKFNAEHETNMEDLQKKEREVLEDEVRADILDVIKQEYDDKYDKAVAEVTHELQQSLREEIRAEYEDLLAHASQQSLLPPRQERPQPQQEQPQQEQIVSPNVQDTRSAEREHENTQALQALQEQIAAITRQMQDMKDEYEGEIEDMKHTHQQQLQNVRAEVGDAVQSKLQLIRQASIEIDALRQQIKQYTNGDWNGVVALR